jgi:hypothetical protein
MHSGRKKKNTLSVESMLLAERHKTATRGRRLKRAGGIRRQSCCR